MRNILANPVYAGDWYWNKNQQAEPKTPVKAAHERTVVKSSQTDRPREEWVHIPVPPIIARDMYEAAARQTERNKEKGGRPGTRKDLLRRMLVCSFCGRTLLPQTLYGPAGAKARTPYTQYRCSGHRTLGLRDVCRCPYITGGKLEADLWERITTYLTNEDEIMDTLRKREQGREAERERDAAQLEVVFQGEAEVKRQRHRLLDLQLAEPPLIDRETAQERAAELERRAEELQSARAAVEERMRSWAGGGPHGAPGQSAGTPAHRPPRRGRDEDPEPPASDELNAADLGSGAEGGDTGRGLGVRP